MNMVLKPESMTLDQKIGQMLLIGFGGGEDGLAALERLVSQRPIGNLILFARNAGPAEQVRETLSRVSRLVEARTGVAPLVAADQEGGTVLRFRDGVSPLPGAMALAAAVGAGRPMDDIAELARAAAADLLSLGINWNLGPVADVNINPANPVIGVRSFGEDPEAVAEFASVWARGMQEAGVLATAKHFPGHGDTSVDSHLGLPRVDAGPERIDSVELVPFRRLIADGIASIMTAHVLFPTVEPDSLPATLSRRVLTGLLRDTLGYDGLIVTDCLEMKAVDGRYESLAVRAVLAGADMLCISHTPAKQEAAFDGIRAAVLDGTIPESRIDESVARIMSARARVGQGYRDREAPGPAERERMVQRAGDVASTAVTRFGDADIPDLSRGGFYLDLTPVALTGAEDVQLYAGTVLGALRGLGAGVDGLVLRCDLSEEDADRAVEAVRATLEAGTAVSVVMGVFALVRYPAQLALAGRLAALCDGAGVQLSFVSMREP